MGFLTWFIALLVWLVFAGLAGNQLSARELLDGQPTNLVAGLLIVLGIILSLQAIVALVRVLSPANISQSEPWRLRAGGRRWYVDVIDARTGLTGQSFTLRLLPKQDRWDRAQSLTLDSEEGLVNSLFGRNDQQALWMLVTGATRAVTVYRRTMGLVPSMISMGIILLLMTGLPGLAAFILGFIAGPLLLGIYVMIARSRATRLGLRIHARLAGAYRVTAERARVAPSNPRPPQEQALAAPAPAAAWHPDPTGRHEYRYWDGQRWTAQVSNAGATSIDPV